MASVEMRKLSVIGLLPQKDALLQSLMRLGVVELNSQEERMKEEEWAALVKKDSDEQTVYEMDSKIAAAAAALETLQQLGGTKKSLFAGRTPLSEAEFGQRLSQNGEAEQLVQGINQRQKEINAAKSEMVQLDTAIFSLTPWKAYDAPLSLTETKRASIFLGTVPASVGFSALVNEVQAADESAIVQQVFADKEFLYFNVVCLKENKDQVLDALRSKNFNLISFGDYEKTPSETITLLSEQKQEWEKKEKALEQEVASLASRQSEIELWHDSCIIRRDRAAAYSDLLVTKTAFYFDGWMPYDAEAAVRSVLEENKCYYEIAAPAEEEDHPVLLRQKGLAEPFQVITDLYSTPSVRDLDPTPYLAPFYFIFFGLMLSDAAYGLILSVACFIIKKKFRLEGMMKQLITMFFYCGISTAFWGILFGGYFGNAISVIASTFFHSDFTLPPVWFDPVSDPMTLLVFSLILGAIHLFAGMGLQAYQLICHGQVLDAIFDIFLWYLLLIGLVLFGIGGSVAEVVATIGKWMSIVGAVGILFTGGRSKKGIIGKLIGGLGSLYGITSYLSDVLSYSRLLALGLATGIVAQVINTLGSLAGGGVVGAIVMLVVFVVGHVFNMAINVMGSFVHASRLQYVEFFGKFFEGGGRAFRPFRRNTKYVDIVKEEK